MFTVARPVTRLVVAVTALTCSIVMSGCGAAPTSAAPSSMAEASGSVSSAPTNSPSASSPSAASPSASSSTANGAFQDCPLATLPAQAADTVRLIKQGGPFPYPKNDGITFMNRERILPKQERGYYREHTVITPGSKTRGKRRIITGGQQPKTPHVWYYTQDHYQTFCSISGT